MVSLGLLQKDAWEISDTLYRGGDVVGLNPSIRIYRYTKGQFFDCHCQSITHHSISRANIEFR